MTSKEEEGVVSMSGSVEGRGVEPLIMKPRLESRKRGEPKRITYNPHFISVSILCLEFGG